MTPNLDAPTLSILKATTSISALMLGLATPTLAAVSIKAPSKSTEIANNIKAKQGVEEFLVKGKRQKSSIAALHGEPRIVNVVPFEILSQQGVTSLEQALRNVPGITTQIGEGGVMNGDQFFIRGISAKNDIFTDGLRDFGVYTRDSFNYEQIEVLKGPSSTTLGRGVTGGGINTSSKAPKLSDFLQATSAFGSADYRRGTADWNKQLSDNSAFRLNIMYHNNDVAKRDLIQSERWGIAPSIGFGLNGDTQITISYLHQEDNRVPDYGVPTTLVNGVGTPVTELGVNRATNYGFTTDTDESIVNTLTIRLNHKATESLTITSDTKVGHYTRYFQQTVPRCTGTGADCKDAFLDNDPTTVPMARISSPGPYDQKTWGIQNVTTALATMPLGGMKNELLLGIDASYQNNDRKQFNYSASAAPKSLLNPVHGESPALAEGLNNTRDTSATDLSAFLSNRLWLNDKWSLIGGLRVQHYHVEQKQVSFNPSRCNGTEGTVDICFTPLESTTWLANPKASIVFEPSDAQSYYVSFATSATPPGVTVSNGSRLQEARPGFGIGNDGLDPEKNTSWEAGARFGLANGKVNIQTAIFQINKNNAKDTDPLSDAIIASGEKQRLRGFEFGLNGELASNLSIAFNYTHINSKILESFSRRSGTVNEAAIGKKVQYVPANAASLWTTYQFEGTLEGLQIGAGLTWQDKVYLDNDNETLSPAYVVFDALLAYNFSKYRLSVNAYNLGNKLYYSQVHSSRIVPAAGRSVVASLGVNF